jgi:ribonuclease HI
MSLPRVKYSGGKTVPHSDLRAGTTLGAPRQEDNYNNMKVLQWNAGGLKGHKKSELRKTLEDEEIDVFCILEANVTEENIKYLNLENYNLNLLPKSRQIASGILVGAHKRLKHTFSIVKRMIDADKVEIVKLQVWKNDHSAKIFGIYNPPNNDPDLRLVDVSQRTVVVGDFNAHFQDVGYKNVNKAGRTIEDFILTNNIELLYTNGDTPTFLHHNKNTTNPDLTLASTDIAHVASRKIIDDQRYGHRMIITTINLRTKPKAPNNKPHNAWNFKKAKWHKYKEELDLELKNTQFNFKNEAPDKNCEELCSVILKIAQKHIPKGKILKYKPFWSDLLTQLKNEREMARKKAELSKDPKDVQAWREKATIVEREIVSSKKQTFQNFLKSVDYRKDASRFHRFISTMNDKHSTNHNVRINSKHSTNYKDKEIAKAFTSFYASRQHIPKYLKKQEKLMKYTIKQKCRATDQETIFNTDFKLHELTQAIASLRTKKSPGPDLIMAEFLKHLGTKALSICLQLFNQIWTTTVPAMWRKAIIIPILKAKKPDSELSSYRPISLTSILAKTMEKMISARLNWYLETENLLSPAQAGFRKYCSTNQQITMLSQEIKDSLDRQETMIAVFVDFKSAYDSVWRVKLVDKLQAIGVKGRMLKWIHNFITQRFCATKFENKLSKYKQIRRGLPQGAVTSTTLFNVMINDLPTQLEKIKNVRSALFADDLVIWTSLPKGQEHKLSKIMHEALSTLSNWCKENAMTINTEKTFYQIFTLRHKQPTISLQINNKPVVKTHVAKYLGMYLDRKLTWRNHVQKTAEKFKEKLSVLKRLAGSKWGSSRSILNATYKAYIKPILQYGCEALITATPATLDKLEVMQNQALRLITGAVKSTPPTPMQVLTMNNPLEREREKMALLLYEKLTRLPYDNYWSQYKYRDRNLKTQNGFMQKVTPLRQKYSLQAEPEKLLLPLCPLHYIEVDYKTDLLQEVKKKDTDQAVMKLAALETIRKLYPEKDWLHIYTDGSHTDKNGNAGAGIHCKLFSFCLTLGQQATHFDGELEAMNIALRELFSRIGSFKKAVIFSDSTAAIRSLAKVDAPPSNRVKEIHSSIKQLKGHHKDIKFQWVPSHCGVLGNEMADYLAKKGTEIRKISVCKLSFHSAKLRIKGNIQADLARYYATKGQHTPWNKMVENRNIIPDFPQGDAVATFRLITGHDYLAAHLHRLKIYQSPMCVLCKEHNSIMNQDHLPDCTALNSGNAQSLVKLYWEARRRMEVLEH